MVYAMGGNQVLKTTIELPIYYDEDSDDVIECITFVVDENGVIRINVSSSTVSGFVNANHLREIGRRLGVE